MNEINDGILKVSTTAAEFSHAAWIFFREDGRGSSLLSIPAVEHPLGLHHRELAIGRRWTDSRFSLRAARKEHLCTANWL